MKCKDCGYKNKSGRVYCKNCSGKLYPRKKLKKTA